LRLPSSCPSSPPSGCGAYLSRLPVDEIKIDKVFIVELVRDSATEAVVDAVIGLGRRLGRTVVAEGVEDQETFDRLAGLGCDVAQGYLLSRPIPPDTVPAWLLHWESTRREVCPVGGPDVSEGPSQPAYGTLLA